MPDGQEGQAGVQDQQVDTTGQQGQGQGAGDNGSAASGQGQAVNWQEKYAALEKQANEYKGNFERISPYVEQVEDILARHPELQESFRRASLGLPPKEAAAPANGNQRREEKADPYKEKFEQMERSVQSLQMTLKEKEMLSTLETSMAQVNAKFDPEGKNEPEFWKRFDSASEKRAFEILRQHPGTTRTQAMKAAQAELGRDITTAYYRLMEDKITEHFANKGKNSGLAAGVFTAADGVGKPGLMLEEQERLKKMLRDLPPDHPDRGEVWMQLSKITGKSTDQLMGQGPIWNTMNMGG